MASRSIFRLIDVPTACNLKTSLYRWLVINNSSSRKHFLIARTLHTLFKTDSIREGCLACQNKNPRNTRWKSSFKGLRANFCKVVSSDLLSSEMASPNCPAEFNNETPLTCSGNTAAATRAVKPPRLRNQHGKDTSISSSTSTKRKFQFSTCRELRYEEILKQVKVRIPGSRNLNS